MEGILRYVNGFVWGVPALVLILGVGFYFSFLTGWSQLRFLPKALAKLKCMIFSGDSKASYRALCTALAATVGTGNIAGVAGAIALGGPGSIFWMWVCGILGMVTKYAEALLSVVYRGKSKTGERLAGPMYLISEGLGRKFRWLGVLYCFFGCLAAFGMGNATQINAVVESAASAACFFGKEMPHWLLVLLGVIIGLLGAWSVLGGVKRVGEITSFLVPLASAAYIVLCLWAIGSRFHRIPLAIAEIIRGAFQPKAVTGGVIGSAFAALRVGASRGVFTNEAGMGTAAIAHGTADPAHPCEQGLMGILEVFLDTIVICTLTAFVILTSGISIPYGADEGAVLTIRAFSQVLGPWVSVAISVFLAVFAFATILGWGFYGIQCARYLLGDGCEKPFALVMFLGCLLGIFMGTGPVWLLSETVNGFMAIPSLLALMILAPKVEKLTKDYQKRASEDALFRIREEKKGVSRSSLRHCGR